MSDLLGAPIPGESRATCDACAMCESLAPGAESFNPATKCCTYLPVLPNYLVGGILADTSPEGAAGRASVEARIARRIAVTPLGLSRPAVPDLLYQFGSVRGFGHSLAMRCPHYLEEGGRCGIWQHRNAVCATWFCKHDRGEAGAAFWQRVQELLSTLERDLARWCLVELGVGHAALARLFPLSERSHRPDGFQLSAPDLDDASDPGLHAELWGEWLGREVEMFRASARLMEGADVVEVLRRSGPDARIRVELVRAAWQRLNDDRLPMSLRAGPLRVIRVDGRTCRLTTYSGLDPVEVPRDLFDALSYFEGRSTEDARAAMSREGGLTLSTSLIRKMVDFGVLVSSDEPRAESLDGAEASSPRG